MHVADEFNIFAKISYKAMAQHAEWTDIITPRKKRLDLKLGELWRYRDLVYLLIRRDIVAQYKQTILGPLWFVIQPLFTTLIFTVVFGRIAGLSTDGQPALLFYLANVVCWQYFANCLSKTSSTFTANARIFGKVYFPRLAVPVSVAISNMVTFGVQFCIFLGFWAYYKLQGYPVSLHSILALLPLLILIMALLGLGSGIIISSLTTRYRDLQNLVAFGVQLLMYATPVIFPLSAISRDSWFYSFLYYNPLSAIMETFRFGFLGTGMFDWWHLSYSFAVAILIFFSGTLLFNRVERTFMDTV
jgi:lipopolysaccharide transport system permease protein